MGMMTIRKSVQKFFAPVVVILVIGMAVGLFYVGFPASQKQDFGYKGPAAKVYGTVIKDSDFNDILIRYQQQMSQYAGQISEAELRDQTLSRAVTDLAYKMEMDKAGSKINASMAEVNEFIKKQWPTDEELQSVMQQYGKATEGEFKRWIQDSFRYRNFVSYKCRELGMKADKESILENVEKITVSHILIMTKDQNSNKVIRSDAEALKIANDIYNKVTTGSDFAAMAKEYSEDPGSKEKGGTYGPFSIAQFKSSGFVKEFIDGALALKTPGQISQPIKTVFGYHILKLNDRSMPKGKEYKKEYAEAEGNVFYTKSQDPSSPFSTWMQDINQKAIKNMEILDPGLKAFRDLRDKKYAEAANQYELALKRPYYKDKIEMYTDAANVYGELKKYDEATKVLKKAPANLVDTLEYQIAMAKIYQSQGQSQKAEDILTQYSNRHAGSAPEQHAALKQIFTEWKMTAAADREAKIVETITKLEEENRKKYEESLQQRQQTESQTGVTNPAATPGQ
jgi:parvulin-like peptidyl-prolyl isomerase